MSIDPDAHLAEITQFLTGHRSLQGYARFADTVRALHNHLSAGGALPARWQPAIAGNPPDDGGDGTEQGRPDRGCGQGWECAWRERLRGNSG